MYFVLALFVVAMLLSPVLRGLFAALGWLLIGFVVFAVAGPVGVAALVAIVALGCAGWRARPLPERYKVTWIEAPAPPEIAMRGRRCWCFDGGATG
jgi:hypothetical protein